MAQADVIDVAGRVTGAAETATSYAAAAVENPAAPEQQLASLRRQVLGYYGAQIADPADKEARRLYMVRTVGAPEDTNLSSLLDSHLLYLLNEMRAVPKLRARGFALYAETGGDPDAAGGAVMREDMARVLGVLRIDTRKLVTAAEWRTWNETLERQLRPGGEAAESETPQDSPFEDAA
jgi:hypothetical protein